MAKKMMIGCLTLVCVMVCAWAEDMEGPDAPITVPVETKLAGPLGVRSNPVRCDMPRGERAYLARLRGLDEQPPRFYRVGSYAPGPYGNILDGYRVTSGTNTVMIFMDMYHPCFIETNAVPGFTIVNE